MKIAVLGGGQLARMLALSAYPLGIQVTCIDRTALPCASLVTKVIESDFKNHQTLMPLLDEVDCITFETENILLDFVSKLPSHKIHPNIEALKITQDRFYEKNLLNELSIPTSDYAVIESWDHLEEAISQFNFPVVLKTRREGYDGKGQAILYNWEDAKKNWINLKNNPLILEKYINFEYEVSLIAVRNKNNEIKYYPLVLNEHRNGILHTSKAPFQNDDLQNQAERYAYKILNQLNYIGVMAIEFFYANGKLLVNEMAPRVHNSGHWTIEGAVTSQFENHLRAVLNLPLGNTDAIGFSMMHNMIGQEPNIKPLLQIPNLHYHSYGKAAKPNRKLGHITLNAQDLMTLEKNFELLKNQLNKQGS